MNRRVRCYGLNGEQIGDFEEIAPNDWRGVDYQRTAGICIYTWQLVITRLADLIGTGDVYRMDGTLSYIHMPFIEIDRSRNTWLGSDYLDPSRYLPLLIPMKAPEPVTA